MKTLATLTTYDPADCTSTGWRYSLYSDGHVSAESHSRWTGTRTGARYVTAPGHVDVSELEEGNPDKDAKALLAMAVQHVHPSEDRDWKQIRRGTLVR